MRIGSQPVSAVPTCAIRHSGRSARRSATGQLAAARPRVRVSASGVPHWHVTVRAARRSHIRAGMDSFCAELPREHCGVERLLTFRQIECACGAARIVGVACPDCGAAPDPREVDPAMQARRAAAQEAERALSTTTPRNADGDAPDRAPTGRLFDALAGWLERFLAAWASAGTSPAPHAGEGDLV